MFAWGVAAAGSDPNGHADAAGDGIGSSGSDVRTWISRQLRGLTEEGGEAIPRTVESCFAGTTERLTIPAEDATVIAMDLDARFQLATATELPDGEFLLECTNHDHGEGSAPATTIYARFDGPASVDPSGETVSIAYWKPTRVMIGQEPRSGDGPAHITVEPTPEGVATAITHMSSAHQSMAPARSHPNHRGQPPVVGVGEETSVPSSVVADTPDTGIEMTLPRSMDALFVGAPLAYYLGATVTVEERERPVLRAPEAGVERELAPLPEFQHECADLLRRMFYLDCQTRVVSPDNEATAECLPSRVDVDLEDARSLDPAPRLARYLSVPAEDLDPALPDWHLSTYASPGPERVRCLPYLLDSLSLVYLPEATELQQSDLLNRTLDDALSTRGTVHEGDYLQPEPQLGRVHGWMADGSPIDAFKFTATAYENRLKTDARRNDCMKVSVVLNDESMDDEQERVARFYRKQYEKLPIDVTVDENLPRKALARVFEAENDFVHYIGHCDDEGLRCPDGNLDVADIEQARTRTFFLNACGSYDQGLELIEQGAISGAVTYKKVLDGQAAKVGTAFARLIVHGFSFERALQLARRRIMMGKDYAVVGDGTYALLPSPKPPVTVWLEGTDDGDYDVSCEVLTVQSNGGSYRLPFDGSRVLNGRTTEIRLSPEEVWEALAGTSLPVVYEGDVHWSDEMASIL